MWSMHSLFLFLFSVTSIHALHGFDGVDPQNLTKIPEHSSETITEVLMSNKVRGKNFFALQRLINRNREAALLLLEQDKDLHVTYSELEVLENRPNLTHQEKTRLQEERKQINLHIAAGRMVMNRLYSDRSLLGVATKRRTEMLQKWRLVVVPCWWLFALCFLWKTSAFYFGMWELWEGVMRNP
jgi:hypothetical protein